MRRISVQERRWAMVRRHELAGAATGPEEVTRSLLALHATDPASVHLSVLARSHTTTLAEVSAALDQRRTLVRWMAMRRTVFVLLTEDVPMVQAAVSTPLAGALRRRLVARLLRNGADPPIEGDVGAWVEALEAATEQALTDRGSATGAELAQAVTGLRTTIRPRAPSDRTQRVTTSLLTLLGAGGRAVRGTPTGPWTSRHAPWEPITTRWPAGLPDREATGARRDLAARWLARFGPATADDLQWWTGWGKTATAGALAALPVVEVDLHGRPGLTLVDDAAEEVWEQPPGPPTAALLPALDPTPMGWRDREWFLSVDPAQLYDASGNIGPTVWWDGEVIGSWAVAADGEVRTAVVVDRGAEARAGVEARAGALQSRLAGSLVTPAVRTPLERTLT